MNKNPIRVIILAAVAALVLAACASVPVTTSQSVVQAAGAASGGTTATPTSGAPNLTKEPVAAIVNTHVITLADLNDEVNRRLDGIKSLGDSVPSDQAAFRLSVLDSMIDQSLIEQAAAIQGIKVTDADVDAEVQTDIQIAGSADKWKAQLVGNHMTEAQYREGVRSALITQKMRDVVTAGIGNTAEQVHARHILVSDQATAKDIAAKLQAGGDFAQLAAQYSLDVTTKNVGGDLGWFSRGQLLQKAVEDAAFGLGVNQISGPVKSDLGYHIIQTLERAKDKPIDAQTRYRLAQDAFDTWIQTLKKSAHIEKFPNGQA